MSKLHESLQEELKTLEYRERLSPVDLLSLPPALSALLQKIVRQNGMKLADIAADQNQTLENTQKFLDELMKKGYLCRIQSEQEVLYKANFGGKAHNPPARSRRRACSVLDSLGKETEKE